MIKAYHAIRDALPIAMMFLIYASIISLWFFV
jgi:hypothetical protein